MITDEEMLLVDAFSEGIVDFSHRTSSLVEQLIPEYSELRDKGEGYYLRESLTRLYISFVEFAKSTRTGPDESFVAQTKQRAYQGVPLDAILKVWRIANRAFWTELVAIADGLSGRRSLAIGVWSAYLEFADMTIQASEDAYKAAQHSRYDLQQLSATMMLDKLLIERDNAVIDHILSNLGIVERDLVVIAASAHVEDSRRLEMYALFIPLLSVITTSSGVRPPWTTNGGKFIAIAERANLAERIRQAEAEIKLADRKVMLGISRSYLNSDSLADCLDEALKSLSLTGENRPIVFFDQLTTLELIALNSTVPLPHLPSWLNLYREGDEEHDHTWSETIEALVRCGGNVTSAAKALFVHPNTVYYRLTSIRTACGVDIVHPENLTSAYLVGLLSKVRATTTG